MKCQICHKNEANILFTQIVNNEKIVLQICSECAREKGLTLEITAKPPSAIQESLVGSLTGTDSESGLSETPDLTCSVCGLTFAEFKKSGLFGCDRCHEAFGDHIVKLLKQIHGLARHEGKSPRAPSDEVNFRKEIRELRKKLNDLVAREEYEKAAELRDRINKMEGDGLR
jgi:protein arginine kinase activator